VIRYVRGDATLPGGAGRRIIAHVVNDQGGWGRGFVVALSKRHPQVEAAYRRWARRPAPDDPPFMLGEVQFVPVALDLWVANMLAQHAYRTPDNPVPLDYDALARALAAVARFAAEHEAAVHMPRIGAGLAGGEWSRIEEMIGKCLAQAEVTVYEW
jgi:O-acetyl-ADP-ribose deacetylase (regulator of RNase III)